MSDVSQIDGNAVRLRRESQGWALSDLATRACLSVKQVRQIEEGGMTAFYSETVKITAARKIAGLLGMSETQLFGQQVAVIETGFDHDESMLLSSASPMAAQPQLGGGLNAQNTPFTRSEALHILAQPPEHIDDAEHDSEPVSANSTGHEEAQAAPEELHETSSSLNAEDKSPTAQVQAASTPPDNETQAAPAPAEGGGYFLKILALFVLALAAAALLKPSVVDEKPAAPAAEAPAPLPVVSPPETNPAPLANAEVKPAETKSAESKSPENKPSDTKPTPAATSENKP
jgi:transcriptional regulator with XRE-family HTH domain